MASFDILFLFFGCLKAKLTIDGRLIMERFGVHETKAALGLALYVAACMCVKEKKIEHS